MNLELIAELAVMAAEDQRIRAPRPDEQQRFVRTLAPEEIMEWRRVDAGNTDRLREIIAVHGWPGFSLVGEDGAEHAWLVAQHADGQLDFQREALRLLAGAVAAGEASPAHLAYLTDRVNMNEGREQRYGTQMAGVADGRPVPWPIEAPDGLDKRRAAVGLEPFAEYAAGFGHLTDD